MENKTESLFKEIVDKFDKHATNREKGYLEKSRKVELFLNKGIVEKKHPTIIKDTATGKEKIEVLENVKTSIDNFDRHKKVVESLTDGNAKTYYKTYMFNIANRKVNKPKQ